MTNERSPQSQTASQSCEATLTPDDILPSFYIHIKCSGCGFAYQRWANCHSLQNCLIEKKYHRKPDGSGRKCGLFEIVKVEKV